MKSRIVILIAVTLISSCIGFAQTLTKNDLVSHFGFNQETLPYRDESIHFYTFKTGRKEDVKNLILYIQGSDPSPLFSYSKTKEQNFRFNCFLKNDYQFIKDNYLYVAIEKTGFEGLINKDSLSVPEVYHQSNSLLHRVNRINKVIDHLYEAYNFEKLIVYGHSEGAPVAAKLATVNKKITHLGFWAGNALPDFFDVVLEQKKAYYKGELSDKEASEGIQMAIDYFANVISKDSTSTQVDEFGYTNKRWWSYAEPPLNNLLKLEIPIYVQVSSKDESAPIESSYLIPLEFARLNKTNLSYNVCIGCNHSFMIVNENGTYSRKWNEFFLNFIDWAQKN